MDNFILLNHNIVAQIGDGAGKFIAAEAAKQARKIVIGG